MRGACAAETGCLQLLAVQQGVTCCHFKRGAAVSLLSPPGKFSAVLTDAVNCLAGGIELRRPDERLAAFEPRPGSYTAAAADAEAARAAEECLSEWCKQVEELLAESDAPAPGAWG